MPENSSRSSLSKKENVLALSTEVWSPLEEWADPGAHTVQSGALLSLGLDSALLWVGFILRQVFAQVVALT